MLGGYIMAKRTFNNINMDIERWSKNKNLYHSYDGESLKDILDQVPFELVNIPLYSYNNILAGDEERSGNQVVGYIYGYDRKTDMFSVVIHEKYAAAVSEFAKPIIFPRVQIIGDKVTRILGFDVCPRSYYAVIK